MLACNLEFIPKVIELVKGQVVEAVQRTNGDLPELVNWMLANCPVPQGGATHIFTVVTPPGKEIMEHDHKEDVLLYYVEPTGTPVIITDVPYLPQRGELLYMPKHVFHRVPPNMSEITRISVAVKI